jgi:hypothetical protein
LVPYCRPQRVTLGWIICLLIEVSYKNVIEWEVVTSGIYNSIGLLCGYLRVWLN